VFAKQPGFAEAPSVIPIMSQSAEPAEGVFTSGGGAQSCDEPTGAVARAQTYTYQGIQG
jgi:hypothetical protein